MTCVPKPYLKPCPFCGGEAQSGVQFYKSDGSEVTLQAIVKCKEGCVSRNICFKASKIFELVPFEDFSGAFNIIVDKWNTRAED